MWIPFSYNDTNTYLIKIIQKDDSITIYVTDLKIVWEEKLDQTALFNRFQELNPTFDIEVDTAISQVIKLITNIENSEKIIDNKESVTFILKLKGQLESQNNDFKFKIKFDFNLSPSSQNVIADELTAPLVHTVKYLEEQQKMLMNLLQKKDRELEEFRLEKGEISRDDLITQKFDSSILEQNNSKLILNVFDKSSPFWSGFVKRYGDVEVNIAPVTLDPWNQRERKRKIRSKETTTKSSSISYKINKK